MPQRRSPARWYQNTRAGRLAAWSRLGFMGRTTRQRNLLANAVLTTHQAAEAVRALGALERNGLTPDTALDFRPFFPSYFEPNMWRGAVAIPTPAWLGAIRESIRLLESRPDWIRGDHFTVPAEDVRVESPGLATADAVVGDPEDSMPMPLTPDEARERLQEVADATRPHQFSLLPEQRLVGRLEFINTRAIRYRRRMPDQSFVDSVGRWGVVQPIAVVDRGEHFSPRYQIAAGRRRLTAATLCNMLTIPALVYPTGTPIRHAASIALMENALRAENPLVDLAAIEALIREGATMAQITDELGIDRRTVRLRMRLADLIVPLREALESGGMAHSVALAASRLTSEQQQTLFARLLPNHPRLTMTDVREVGGSQYEQQIRLLEEAEDVAQRREFQQVRVARMTTGAYQFAFGDGIGPTHVIRVNEARFDFLPLAVVRGAHIARGEVEFSTDTEPRVTLADGQTFLVDRLTLRDRGGETFLFGLGSQLSHVRRPYEPVVNFPATPRRGEVDGPSDDRELTPEQVEQIATEMQRTQLDAGEDTWERVEHLLTLASACVPAAPDSAVEQVWVQIESALASARAMVS